MTARAVEAARSGPTPQWTTARVRVGGSRQPSARTFELVADNDIAVWQSLVRPVLIVRCVAGTTEVFVWTDSAASFERDTRLHTVKLRFDDGGELSEMWEHSADHDALFAPDGRALANRIVNASSMAFTFTPFNARPAVARFSVAGLSAQLPPAARKSCGWKPGRE